jgi:hypothetical protein
MGITLFSSATTSGVGSWQNWDGRLRTKSAHLFGNLGGGTVTMECRTGSSTTVGVPVNGYSETSAGIENITLRTYQIRGVISTDASTALNLNLVLI